MAFGAKMQARGDIAAERAMDQCKHRDSMAPAATPNQRIKSGSGTDAHRTLQAGSDKSTAR
jgi:hypothetical protein